MRVGDYVRITRGLYRGEKGVVKEIGAGTVCVNDKWFDNRLVKPVPQRIKAKYLAPNSKPEMHGDWIDLKAAESIKYEAGEAFMIPLGVAMKLPKGYEGLLLPRSSTFKNFGIIMTCSMGVIDEAYCGDEDQWHFPAYSLKAGEIKAGDRIAQFRIIGHQPTIKFVPTLVLSNKNRGGFGSSGK